jgi:hypothetical protein
MIVVTATPGRAARHGWVITGTMLYMVIETYTHGPEPVYARAAERGRMLPGRIPAVVRLTA